MCAAIKLIEAYDDPSPLKRHVDMYFKQYLITRNARY